MPIDQRHPREIRADVRAGHISGVTTGLGSGYVQANLAALPRDQAYDFLLFCQRNSRPCPLLEVTEVGAVEPVGVASGADLRTDIPRYRIYRDGVLVDETTDATEYWRDDLVAFLLGCSFTFEWALLEAGVPLRHIEQDRNVAMWRTSIPCRPAGVFHGQMVVSMRPIPASLLSRAVTASARFPGAHGAPIHIGDPATNGEMPALNSQEITTIVYGLLLAGHETTTSLLANALRRLLTDLDAWKEIGRDSSLIPNAIEEVLRLDSSVIAWRRKTTQAVEIGSVPVPADANLLLLLGSANRDPAVFENPDRFDIYRTNAKDHLSFGHGAHYCLGAPLGRLEARVVIEVLSERLPGLRLVPEQKLPFQPNTSFRGPLSLLVEWDA
jgi:uncharacterized protein YcsI (UPF0317 family)